MKRILLSWSSGKDSAWALHVLRQQGNFEVVGLLTTFNQEADRVAMHAVRRELVVRQAELMGFPLWPVLLPWPCPNEQYESLMAQTCAKAVSEGIEAIALDRKSTRLNSSHVEISYAVFCLKKKKKIKNIVTSKTLNIVI